MGYNRLTSPASTTSSSSLANSPPGGLRPPPATNGKKCLAITFSLVAVVLLLASAVSGAVLVTRRSTASSAGADLPIHRRPTSAIDRTCSQTTYPKLCVNSLINFPGAAAAGERELVPISINATLQRFHRALYGASAIAGRPMHPLTRSAYDACVELMETSAAQLSQSLAAVAGKANADDVLTWLSAAATNQDTCGEGLADVEGAVKVEMEQQLRDLGELVSNCLAIFAASKEYFGGVPIQDRRRRRRRLMAWTSAEEVEFPAWVRRGDRRLLMMPTAGLKADYVVSKDGQNCTHTTIEAAIKAVPEYSSRRVIIYVRAGR